ncbi:hypothetical protein CHS0354_012303 [Potamilus streckersoni]|uniref:Uncharacterized protein n=1 Tax=Potamilus streckersoni TaxID=2493646 RepID=A0AAE0SJQ0_9BIVA|nr:hypothetical protein CHS0354_012303 [Potamilus streckersoni]
MHKLFQTVHEEHEDLIEGKITGTIPSWLSGSLYRNGPGMYEVGENKYSHWFDPMAMFHRFYVKDGKAYYQSKYLRSETYKRNMAENRIVFSQFGTVAFPDPCKNIFQRFLSYFQADDSPRDNTNVSFYPVGDELYATTETHIIHRVDPDTLDTLGTVDLTKYVAINNASAHPHWEKDGTVHMIGNVYKEGAICIAKFPPKSSSAEDFPQGEIVATVIRSNKMAMNYIHSYAMTDNYYVFVEQPLVINIWKIMLAKYTGTSLLSAMEWKPELKAKFHILDKKTGKEVNADISYEADAFIVFHHGNAYEDNEHIVIDLCAISTDKPLQYSYLKNLQHEDCVKNWRKQESPKGRRYVLPLNVTKEVRNSIRIYGDYRL